jgi:hypothetical protein
MKSFKTFITENLGDDHDFGSQKPYHSYTTDDGHKIDVHVINRLGGKSAIFYNKNLGDVTKVAHWGLNADEPTKEDLRKIGHDEEDEHGQSLLEKFTAGGDITPDTAGKIAEHSTAMHLMHIAHKTSGTYGSPEHKKAIQPHIDAINKLGQGAKAEHVDTRVEHGKIAANAIHEAIRQKHGEGATITSVGHTSKKGDIGRFTKGQHNDTQENPSDVSIEVSNSQHALGPEEKHYEGYSLKSSKKSNVITAKNPSIHMDGILDHPRRKLNTDAISRTELGKVHTMLGVGHLKSSERKKYLDDFRKKEGVKSDSSLEGATNELARPAKTSVAKELHDHLDFLTKHSEGHEMIGKMLKKHLTADTSMPWSKVHIKGDTPSKVHAAVTSGSDSPLNKLFNDKTTKYAVTRNGDKVTVHKKEKNGSMTPLAHYSPKTKSNAFKENVHGWNVLPAKIH